MDHALKKLIFSLLYYSITNKGQNLSNLFHFRLDEGLTIDDLKFPASLDEIMDMENYSKGDEFYKFKIATATASADADSASSPESESKILKRFNHMGRNCGKKFKLGEPLYRCKECGFDDTCVLCIHCFNPKDHENHHVYTDICTDFTSGICDCGDQEAWHAQLHCKAELASASVDTADDMEEDLEAIFDTNNKIIRSLMVSTLSTVFDYFIDMFNQNIEPLPVFTKEITLKLRELTQQGKIDERSQLLKDLAYSNKFLNNQEIPVEERDYTVMIYNDEYHNYSQATMALRQGVPDNVHTDLLTSKIDSEGRAMLKCSNDLTNLIEGFFAVQTNGLSATLTTWSEYIHQEACKYIIIWLSHCLSLPNAKFQTLFRDVLGEVLCQPRTEPTIDSNSRDMISVVETHFKKNLPDNNPYKFIDVSIFAPNLQIPLGHHSLLNPTEDNLNHISNLSNAIVKPTTRTYSNTRLQHLLYMDNRYWKRLRKDLQNVIIPTLASSIIYKPIFCQQVVEIFNHITRSITYMDREPQLTALRECVVQLFTCPTNAKWIFQNGTHFIDIVWSVIDVFMEFCKIENGTLIWQRVQVSNLTKSYTISFKQGLYTVETLLSKISDPNILLRRMEFITVMTLCKIFNGAWKIKRKEGEHVIHEDQHFIPYLEYTTSIYGIIQTLEKLLENNKTMINKELLGNSIHLLNTLLSHKSLVYKLVYDSHEIVKFTVSNERVSYMNPIHTLFSFLIEKISLEDARRIVSKECDDFLKISDFSLRSVVLCSQIYVGFWVRNGASVLHQASYYKNNPELNSYSRDIHLNQLALLWEKDDTPRVIYNMLDRWELLDWFNGDAEYNKTVYQDKVSLIFQQFIAFTYQLLTERQFFKSFASSEERILSQIKNAIIYSLYSKPLSYSKLLRSVPDYLTEDSTLFDSALSEVSIFVEPKGLADNGIFKLKESLFSKIDPLKLSNLGNEFESSSAIIKAHIAKQKKTTDLPSIILQPQITPVKHLDKDTQNLGNFTRSSVFTKVIYKLLQACLDNEDGTFLNELLHLIHGIFKDDELINGKNSLPETYISKPICALLLSIANSKSEAFSEHILKKADYLLQEMILKKPEEIFESLVNSFGQDLVDEYKAKKLNQGVNLEENEKERKRRLAKKRQAKLMAKFNSQQNKFMKENEEEFEKEQSAETDSLNSDKVLNYEDFTCSLCQDDTSEDFFIIPTYHEHSPIFRQGDIYNVDEYGRPWNGFTNDDQNLTYINDTDLENLKTDGFRGSRKVFVSCNHHIHYNCFKRYIQKKGFLSTGFICPLCQTFSNSIVPVWCIPKIDPQPYLDNLLKEEISVDSFIHILREFSSDEFHSVYDFFEDVFTDYQSFDKRVRKIDGFTVADTALVLINHWTNTISMLEISSRLDVSPNESFLKNREQKYKTLKNVLICMVLLASSIGKPNVTLSPYVNQKSVIWNQNQVFQYITKECLFSTAKRSIRDIITETLIRYCNQILTDFISQAGSSSQIKENYEKVRASGEIYDINIEMLETLKSVQNNDMVNENEEATMFYNLAYTCLLSNILPTLRRCLILIKVFHELLNESGEAPFIIEGIDIENDLVGYSTPEYIDTLISLLTYHRSLKELLTIGTKALEAMGSDREIDPYLQNIPYEYCGIVKMVDLAKYLNTYITNTRDIKLREEQPTKNGSNRLDFRICLTCGVKIHLRADHHEMSRHLAKNCFKSFGAFLIPNTSEVCLYLGHPPSTVFISAPYLNSHGEVGRNAMKRGDLTTLNIKRYEYLNKLWINNEIPGYISRVMGDEFRVSILSNGFVFALNRNARPRRVPAPDEDEEDEDDFNDDEGDEFYVDEDDADFDPDNDNPNQPPNLRLFGEDGNAMGGFLEMFENFRDALEGGATTEQAIPPQFQFFGPRFDNFNFTNQEGTQEDEEEGNETTNENDQDHSGQDNNESDGEESHGSW